jgi:hypothetical protein
MINTIGEFTAQQPLRAHQESTVGNQTAIVQKSVKSSIARPVDKTNNSRRSDMQNNDEEKDETTTRHRIEDGQVVLEKYNRQGKLVDKVPPGYVPFGEIA